MYRYDEDSVLEKLYLEEEQVREAQRALRDVDRDGIADLEGKRQQIWAQIRHRKMVLHRW